MDYSVNRIAGTLAVDPDKHGSDREKKRRPVRRGEGHDSITISDEARRRSEATAEEETIPAEYELLE